jgi:hypothetical protein
MTWWVKAIMKARIGKLGIAKVSLDMQEVSAKEVQLKKRGILLRYHECNMLKLKRCAVPLTSVTRVRIPLGPPTFV